MNRHDRRKAAAGRRAHAKRVRSAIRLLSREHIGQALVAAGWAPPAIPAEAIAEQVADTPDVTDHRELQGQFSED